MPYELESDLEKRCKHYAEANGCKLLKIQGTRGWPDRLLICPMGKVVFIEFKREGMRARPLQQHILQDLQSMGFMAIVVDNFNKFQTVVQALKLLSGSHTSTKSEG